MVLESAARDGPGTRGEGGYRYFLPSRVVGSALACRVTGGKLQAPVVGIGSRIFALKISTFNTSCGPVRACPQCPHNVPTTPAGVEIRLLLQGVASGDSENPSPPAIAPLILLMNQALCRPEPTVQGSGALHAPTSRGNVAFTSTVEDCPALPRVRWLCHC